MREFRVLVRFIDKPLETLSQFRIPRKVSRYCPKISKTAAAEMPSIFRRYAPRAASRCDRTPPQFGGLVELGAESFALFFKIVPRYFRENRESGKRFLF
jgi:hypothetical protein